MRKTILLVDDQPDVRRILERMLRSLGFAVLSAGGGEEALALHQQHPGPIHLLVTDLEMPGMDGRQLAAELCRHRPAIGILFLSGHLEDMSLQDDTTESSETFLQKPCTMNELASHVTRLIERLPES